MTMHGASGEPLELVEADDVAAHSFQRLLVRASGAAKTATGVVTGRRQGGRFTGPVRENRSDGAVSRSNGSHEANRRGG
jgi:hypothetical protein